MEKENPWKVFVNQGKADFRRWTIGAYFSLVATVLGLVAAIVYQAAYGGTQYYEVWAVLLPVFGVIGFLFGTVSRVLGGKVWNTVADFMPVVLLICAFATFLTYIHAVYLYLGDVFYAGVTAEAFSKMNPLFIVTAVLYLVAFILSNVACWMRQRKPAAVSAAE